MKRQFTAFVLLTVFILVISGLFIWLTRVKDVTRLAYVPDGDWSKRHVIVNDIQDTYFSPTVDAEGNVHMVWARFDGSSLRGELMHNVTDSKGNVLIEDQSIIKDARIDDFTTMTHGEVLEIFWIGPGIGPKGDLKYARIDRKGTLLEEWTLLENEFTDPSSLRAARTPKGWVFAWIDQVGEYRQVKTLALDPLAGSDRQPHQITHNSYHVHSLNIIADPAGRVHLAWKDESGRNDFLARINVLTGGRHAVQYNYRLFDTLYYQQLTEDAALLGEPVFVDEITLDTIEMVVSGDQLHLAWSKIISGDGYPSTSLVAKTLRHYSIFGTTIDLTKPAEVTDVKRLTHSQGPAYDPALAMDREGQIHLAYMGTYQDRLAATHQVYGRDFDQPQKPAHQLFPDQLNGLETTLVADPAKGVHVFWVQADPYGGKVYYANTVRPRLITPFHVIGLNMDRKGVSTFMSAVYVLAVPIYSFLIYLHLFTLGMITGVLTILKRLTQRWKAVFAHPLVVPAVICAIHVVIYTLSGHAHWVIWPVWPASGAQFWFSVLLATAAAVGYVYFGNVKKGHMLQMGWIAFLWLYWLNIINLMFNIPYINFIDKLI